MGRCLVRGWLPAFFEYASRRDRERAVTEHFLFH